MSEKKYVIPEGMLNVAIFALASNWDFFDTKHCTERVLEAAVCWLAENPIVPTMRQADEILSPLCGIPSNRVSGRLSNAAVEVAVEWQRRMFLASEPEIPEAVKDMMWQDIGGSVPDHKIDEHNRDVAEAYQRGLKAGKA